MTNRKTARAIEFIIYDIMSCRAGDGDTRTWEECICDVEAHLSQLLEELGYPWGGEGGKYMTNEQFLKHAEKYYDSKSFEHAKKLVAVAEAAKEIVEILDDSASRKEVDSFTSQPLKIALENLERK